MPTVLESPSNLERETQITLPTKTHTSHRSEWASIFTYQQTPNSTAVPGTKIPPLPNDIVTKIPLLNDTSTQISHRSYSTSKEMK